MSNASWLLDFGIPTCMYLLRTEPIFTGLTHEYWSISPASFPDCRMGLRPSSPLTLPHLGGIYQYALVDTSGNAQSRRSAFVSRLVFELLPLLSPVSPSLPFPGRVIPRQFQVNLTPNRPQALWHPLSGRVVEAVRGGNNESSGTIAEFGGTEYMVRGRGYARSLEGF